MGTGTENVRRGYHVFILYFSFFDKYDFIFYNLLFLIYKKHNNTSSLLLKITLEKKTLFTFSFDEESVSFSFPPSLPSQSPVFSDIVITTRHNNSLGFISRQPNRGVARKTQWGNSFSVAVREFDFHPRKANTQRTSGWQHSWPKKQVVLPFFFLFVIIII